MSSDATPIESTELIRKILLKFDNVFEKMGLEPPQGPFDARFTLETLRSGVELTFDEITSDGPGEPLRANGKRIIAYIPDNQYPKVHVRFCRTLKKMETQGRDDRYVAQLPTRDGFIMKNGRTQQLSVCGYCLNAENREVGRSRWSSDGYTSESIIALILADFSNGEIFNADVFGQMKAAQVSGETLETVSQRHAESSQFEPFTTAGKARELRDRIIQRLSREGHDRKDRRFLERLYSTNAVNHDDFKRIYGNDMEDAKKHFKKERRWGNDHKIVYYALPGKIGNFVICLTAG